MLVDKYYVINQNDGNDFHQCIRFPYSEVIMMVPYAGLRIIDTFIYAFMQIFKA